MELIFVFMLGIISIVIGLRQHKKEQLEDPFYLTNLRNKPVLLNIYDTTKSVNRPKLKL